MINKRYGNILEMVKSGFIIHGCNAQGVMGSGIAKQIKDKWPNVYTHYQDKYSIGRYENIPYINSSGEATFIPELNLGDIIPVKVSDELVIVNAITQRYYIGHQYSSGGREVSYDAIATAFEKIDSTLSNEFPEIDRILHFPAIGAGLGGGNLDIISCIIDNSVFNFDKNLWLLE